LEFVFSNQTKKNTDMSEGIACEFVVEFGSHVRSPPDAPYVAGRPPRDVDVFYFGMKPRRAKAIVKARYPAWKGPIDLTKATYRMPDPCVTVPYPYDRIDQAEWKILHAVPTAPVVKAESVRNSLPSVLREGRGVEVALHRIEQGYPWTICLEERAGTKDAQDGGYGYNNGRLAIAKAVFDHFGEENFREMCQRIWWGPFLERFIREKPSKAGRAECQRYCYGVFATITVNGDSPAEANFSNAHGPYREVGGLYEYYAWGLADIMVLLFTNQ
jgi:hypothetical protein